MNIGCVLFLTLGVHSPSPQDAWEVEIRRDSSYVNDVRWTDASRHWLEIKTDSDLPRGASEYNSMSWQLLNNDVTAIENDRMAYMEDWSREVTAARDHNDDALKQNAAARAHEGRGPHECPCAELANVNSWGERVNNSRENIIGWRTRLLARVQSIDTRWTEFRIELAGFERDVETSKEAAQDLRARRKALRVELEALRGRVKMTQDALRSLQKSIDEGNKQLKYWADESNKALKSSQEKAWMMACEGGFFLLETARKSHMDEAWKATSRLPKRERAAARAQLSADSERFEDQMQALKDAKLGVEGLSTVASDAETREKALELAASAVNRALDSPSVQKALRITGPFGKAMSAAKSMVDSTYDLETQWKSYKRISQMNKNSEGYLKAVAALHEHMKKLVDRIVAIKAELP